jgi:hypothetical protein
VKGEHQLPIAAATNDPYAFWCDIQLYRYYVFDQPVCEVVDRLIQDKTLQGSSCEQSAYDRYSILTKSRQQYFGGPEASIIAVSTRKYIGSGPKQFTYIKDNECAINAGRPIVYCKQEGNPVADDAITLPTNSQTVIAVDASGTYYQK